jgi:hypothetical protein
LAPAAPGSRRDRVAPGGFVVKQVFYSAPAAAFAAAAFKQDRSSWRRSIGRLVGHRLRVHLYDDRVEAWLGATHVVTHPRRRSRRDGKRVHVVEYRHVLPALRRKPQAFADSVYRDGLFPAPAYAEAWRRLSNALPRKEACKRPAPSS